jgi:hypothetical protein
VDTIPLAKNRLWYAVKEPETGRMNRATHRLVDGKHEFISMKTLVLGGKPTTTFRCEW